MQDDLERINRRLLDVLGDFQRLAARRMDEAVKGTLDPAKLAEMLKGWGIDPAQLAGMMSQSRMPRLDPYMVLRLDKSVGDDEVKKRYHELIHKLHPDTSGTEGTEYLFQMVLSSYQLIKRERGWQ